MEKLQCAVCIFTVLLSFSICESNAQTPGPVDCSTIIYDVADCISFVIKGSKELKPTTSCCSGFKSVIKVEPKCICAAFESSVELGIEMNNYKAKIIPKACGAPSNSMNVCGSGMTMTTTPVTSFAKPPKSHDAPAPNMKAIPSPVSPPKKKAPAPAPLTEGTPSPSPPPKRKTPAPVPSTVGTPGPSPPKKKKSPVPAPSKMTSEAPAPSPNSSVPSLLPATSGVCILVLIASAFFF